jgi:hypothetical protein
MKTKKIVKKRKKSYLTPKNYKKYGFENYYKIGKKYYFSFIDELNDDDEQIYDDKGEWFQTVN